MRVGISYIYINVHGITINFHTTVYVKHCCNPITESGDSYSLTNTGFLRLILIAIFGSYIDICLESFFNINIKKNKQPSYGALRFVFS